MHERTDRHQAHAPRNGCNVAGFWGYLVEFYVAFEGKTALFGGIRHFFQPYVNHYGSVLHHVSSDETWPTESCNQDVGGAADFGQVLGFRVRQRHGAVAGVVVALHQDRHGQTHNLASAYHHTMFAAGWNVVAFQHFQNSLWRCRDISGQPFCHPANVSGVETIHVFGRINGLHYAVGIHVFGQGELHNQPVHIGVVIHIPHGCQQVVLGHIVIKPN